MSFSLSGINDGFAWSVEDRIAFDGRIYAYVEVGSTKMVTQDTYKDEEQAKAAGCQLMADTLAELMDVRNGA